MTEPTKDEAREDRRRLWQGLVATGATLAAIGEVYGVSRERVRQVVGGAVPNAVEDDALRILQVLRRDPTITTWGRLWRQVAGFAKRGPPRSVVALGMVPAIERLFRWRRTARRCAAQLRLRARRQARRCKLDGTIPHGAGGYGNYQCRCPICRAAHRERQRRSRARALVTGCPADRHGTTMGYVYYGCRCTACRTVNRDYQRSRRQRGPS